MRKRTVIVNDKMQKGCRYQLAADRKATSPPRPHLT